MRSADLDEGAPDLKPLAAEAEFASLVKHLVDPVVIMDRRGEICFMNLRAERMLGGGLKKRLEAHLNGRPQPPAISQVRFRKDGGGDVIFKIRLSGLKWMGEEATQISLRDVTAYVTAAQRSAQEAEDARKELEESLAELRESREEAEQLRQKIAAAHQAEEASSAAQEWPDQSDPLRLGKVERAAAKRRRELESNGAAADSD